MDSLIAEKIEQFDLRWTPQRLTILEAILKSENKHFCAEEIYEASRNILPSIGMATVYRTLELFCSKGIIQKFNLPNEPTKYEFLEEEDSNHCHYLCLHCGKIYELPMTKKKISISKEQDLDFMITKSSCWYFGYCDNCKNLEGR